MTPQLDALVASLPACLLHLLLSSCVPNFPWLLVCDNTQGCHVHAIARNYGALTAQSRQSLLEDTGFSFVNCRVTGSGALYLGRAWGTFSRVVFAYTYMDNIIIPRGWYNWGDPTREMSVPACFFYLLSSPSCSRRRSSCCGRCAD